LTNVCINKEQHATDCFVFITKITKQYYVFTANNINVITPIRTARKPYESQRPGLLDYCRLRAVREWWGRDPGITNSITG